MKNKNLKKRIVAKYFSSFYQDGKSYDDFLFGTITFDDGEYSVEPTSDDEAYAEDDKRAVLNRILEEKLVLYDGNDEQVIINKENPDFLQTYAALRTNMYGGLVIIDEA